MQGLTGKIYFVSQEEAGDRLYSLERDKRENKYELVFEAAGLKIMAVTLGVENADEDVEADIYVIDAKGTLHRLHFIRGERMPIHTSRVIPVINTEKLLKSWQRPQASKQTISLGQKTFNRRTGSVVYAAENHAITHAMTGSTNIMLVESVVKGR